MLTHIVCYKFKEPTSDNFDRARQALLSMKGIVPQIIDIKAGTDVVRSPRSYDFALVVTFASASDLADYQQNQYHATKVKPIIHSLLATSVSVDFTD